MKKLAKRFIGKILGWQVGRLRRKNKITVIGVVGSIGKTSTKLAIAQVIGSGRRVQYQEGNYNDLVSVPLVFFGQNLPQIFNPFGWMTTFLKNERIIRNEYPFDVVIVELGTDAPGQIAQFGSYLKLDLVVITAITPEHMQSFADLDAVAAEELSVIQFAENVLFNADLVPVKYQQLLVSSQSYGITSSSTYHAGSVSYDASGANISVSRLDAPSIDARLTSFSDAQIYSVLAAISVASLIRIRDSEIVEGISKVQPISGRMQLLPGINNSRIIDDSYNASPEAVRSALDTLYRIDAPQKIALLGNMNELGSFSKQSHIDIGEYCDPQHVNEVVTLGPDSNQYTSPAAKSGGCNTTEFDSPYKAGEYIRSVLKPGAIVLVKGSQNKVFAEEAIKSLLQNPADSTKLVRQSDYWMKIKRQQFLD